MLPSPKSASSHRTCRRELASVARAAHVFTFEEGEESLSSSPEHSLPWLLSGRASKWRFASIRLKPISRLVQSISLPSGSARRTLFRPLIGVARPAP